MIDCRRATSIVCENGENDGSSLRDSGTYGASVPGERGLQEQVFINTYISGELPTERLFSWALSPHELLN